jgi:hypothetical protein
VLISVLMCSPTDFMVIFSKDIRPYQTAYVLIFWSKAPYKIRYNKLKDFNFFKVKIDFEKKISKSKSILTKSSLNGTILSSTLTLKKSKARTFFSKSPDNFFKSQSQNRKIGVRIPSIGFGSDWSSPDWSTHLYRLVQYRLVQLLSIDSSSTDWSSYPIGPVSISPILIGPWWRFLGFNNLTFIY